jgi:hypothetical protein
MLENLSKQLKTLLVNKMKGKGPLMDEDGNVNKSDIKLASDIAWEETMQDACECGAKERRECTCQRIQEYKDRAKEIRHQWFGDRWSNPLKYEFGIED